MPQVDLVTFLPQNFWLVVTFLFFTTFICLYFLVFAGVFYRVHSKFMGYYNSYLQFMIALNNDPYSLYDRTFLYTGMCFTEYFDESWDYLQKYLKSKYFFTPINNLYAIIFKEYKALMSY